MADFASSSSSSSSSSSPPPPPPPPPSVSAASSSAAFDDCSEDACSICLEPFISDDPATITSCKHEYHLHCILEWSQRSKECPICWQLLTLKDPSSQELLNAVEAEKRLRSRSVYSSALTNACSSFEGLSDDHDDSYSDDSDFDEQLMQHLVAASRACYVHKGERERSSGAGPSEVLLFNSPVHVSGVQPTLATSPSGGSSPPSGVPSAAELQPPLSSESDAPFKPRVLYSQPPAESARRLNTSDMLSFPESIKSKFSAASARYKESISKSTRDLKEKLIAHNVSVKELSKGVQREMNASIAGVARMIERLDLTSKRSTSPLVPVCTGGTSAFRIQEDRTGQSPSSSEESGVLVHDVSSDALSLVSGMVAGGVEIPPSCVQSEHDSAKTH